MEEPKPDDEIREEEFKNVKILSPKSLERRVKKLTDTITFTAFESVRRGLFEKHKLIFASLLTFRILMKSGELKPQEVDHLIVGKILSQKVHYPQSESLKSYISEQMYKDCKALEIHIPDSFDNLTDSLVKDHLQWKKWFQAEKAEEADLPKDFRTISFFHKLMLIRALRPDRVTYTLKLFVIKKMGREFIEQEPFSIEKVFKETSKMTPMFFVLWPGLDPTVYVEEIGAARGITIANGKLVNISMGQGQEERAIKELEKASKQGTWCLLQNLHLMISWNKIFERKLEEFQANAHEDFRCFVSSEPPPLAVPLKKIIPESILQKCIKI